MKVCAVEGCARASHCRGWCKMHYERWRRRGILGSAQVQNGREGECLVCSHPDRAPIDAALLSRSIRNVEVAAAYGIAVQTMYRHARRHLGLASVNSGGVRCAACRHPDLRAIEAAVLSGDTKSQVAMRYRLERDVLQNHFTPSHQERAMTNAALRLDAVRRYVEA